MRSISRALTIGLAWLALVVFAVPARAQTAAPASLTTPVPASTGPARPDPVSPPDKVAQATPSLPVDLDRVQQQAEKQPVLKLDEQQLRFYVLVQQNAPKFSDFIGDYDLKNGPTKGGAAMTHQEFLNMVTPRELNELFGATSGSSFAMFQAAVMNAAGQSLVKKAIQDIRQARDDHEVQAIRERIDQELAALLEKNQEK